MKQRNNTAIILGLVIVGIALLGGLSWWILQLLGGEIRPVTSATKEKNPDSPINLGSNLMQGFQKTFSEVPNVPVGLFSYGGSTTWSPIRGMVDKPIQAAWPQFQLRYWEPTQGLPGSGVGIQMVLNDELAFAQSSRSLRTAEYQEASDRGFALRQIPVAIDGVVIAVNPNLEVSGLTLTQLAEIYRGKITNWKAVGGPDLPIIPYSRALASGGTVDYFREQVLQNQPFGNQVQTVRDTTQALRRLAQQPGALYYASASTVVAQCTVKTLAIGKSPSTLIAPYVTPYIPESDCPQKRNRIAHDVLKSGQYPLTRRLFVVIKENGQLDQQAGQAYANLLLTNQGQDLIERAGFVRIR
ncbi:MAG: PstS family phosphate ABC transporter substrate-binding protein [Microcystaceae cyanobacterium]